MKPTRTPRPTWFILAAVVIEGMGLSTAASGGVEVLTTLDRAALAHKSTQLSQAPVSSAVNKSMGWTVELTTGSGTVGGNGLYAAPFMPTGEADPFQIR